MDVENKRISLDVAAHEVSLTEKAEIAAQKLHKHEAEVSQYVRGAVEVRRILFTSIIFAKRRRKYLLGLTSG